MPGVAAERPPREHREEVLVRSYEIDPDGRLRPVVLLRMLQEAAWQHASLLGKGFHQRAEGELFWVLSRLRLQTRGETDRFEIVRLPSDDSWEREPEAAARGYVTWQPL
jgi:hypothetical protein